MMADAENTLAETASDSNNLLFNFFIPKYPISVGREEVSPLFRFCIDLYLSE